MAKSQLPKECPCCGQMAVQFDTMDRNRKIARTWTCDTTFYAERPAIRQIEQGNICQRIQIRQLQQRVEYLERKLREDPLGC